MALQWSEDLSVSYGLIDDQHKELFTRYNNLILACKEGKGREDHIKQHRTPVDHVKETYAELQDHGATVSVITSINHTLLNWLLRHVKQTDKNLGRYLAGQTA